MENQSVKRGFWHKLFGTTPNDGNLQPREAIAYSITGIGQNFICTIIGSYLTIFMTDALLMADARIGKTTGATAVALLMLFTRVYDALNDPIMGSIVDRTRTKWGKCRPYLKWMAVPIGLVTIACFLPVYNSTAKSFIIISVIYVIWSMVFTVADVPYWGLSTAMTNNTTIRGNLLTVARLCCTIGAGAVTVFVPVITSAVTAKYKDADGVLIAANSVANANTLKWTYFICAVVLVIVSMPMFFYGFKTQKRDIPPTQLRLHSAITLGFSLKTISFCSYSFPVFWVRQEPFICTRARFILQSMFSETRQYTVFLQYLLFPAEQLQPCLFRGSQSISERKIHISMYMYSAP